jgi:hypothetical protein
MGINWTARGIAKNHNYKIDHKPNGPHNFRKKACHNFNNLITNSSELKTREDLGWPIEFVKKIAQKFCPSHILSKVMQNLDGGKSRQKNVGYLGSSIIKKHFSNEWKLAQLCQVTLPMYVIGRVDYIEFGPHVCDKNESRTNHKIVVKLSGLCLSAAESKNVQIFQRNKKIVI